MIFSTDYWEKEWDALEKQERRYLRKQKEENPSVIRQKISQKIPEQLESTLNEAFVKAFALVFEKGTGIIEKSYQKNRYEQEYQDNEAIAAKENNRKCKSICTSGWKKQGEKSSDIGCGRSGTWGPGNRNSRYSDFYSSPA